MKMEWAVYVRPNTLVNFKNAMLLIPTGLHHNRCGIRSNMLQKRIVNGASAVPHSWPWMAILETLNTTSGKFRHHCGGSLVQRQFIVTAAHCMVFAPSRNLSHFRIRLGDHDRSVSEPSEQVFKVVRSIVHPLYDKYIFLVKLPYPPLSHELPVI